MLTNVVNETWLDISVDLYRLLRSPLTDSLPAPQCCQLPLFYRYHNEHCSTDLLGCLPHSIRRTRNSRQAAYAHHSSVKLSDPRINTCSRSFIHKTGTLRISFPPYIFPPMCPGILTALDHDFYFFYFFNLIFGGERGVFCGRMLHPWPIF